MNKYTTPMTFVLTLAMLLVIIKIEKKHIEQENPDSSTSIYWSDLRNKHPYLNRQVASLSPDHAMGPVASLRMSDELLEKNLLKIFKESPFENNIKITQLPVNGEIDLTLILKKNNLDGPRFLRDKKVHKLQLDLLFPSADVLEKMQNKNLFIGVRNLYAIAEDKTPFALSAVEIIEIGEWLALSLNEEYRISKNHFVGLEHPSIWILPIDLSQIQPFANQQNYPELSVWQFRPIQIPGSSAAVFSLVIGSGKPQGDYYHQIKKYELGNLDFYFPTNFKDQNQKIIYRLDHRPTYGNVSSK